MKRKMLTAALLLGTAVAGPLPAFAGQAPYDTAAPNVPVSSHDRVYTGDQFSNTVSVVDPSDNKTLGVIPLGAPAPANFSPLYKGQLLVHGMGFSPDHRTIGVVSIGSNSVAFIDTATNTVKHISYVGRAPHEAFWTPDGKQVWMTLKDSGKTEVFNASPPFNVLKVLDTGPITNHVNIVVNRNGSFAYVTIGGLNQVKVFRTSDFAQMATIPVGALPHGLWPSGDGSRIYVGLENGDGVTAIDTLSNRVIATTPIGQAPQALTYVPDAVPNGAGTQNLVPLGLAGQATHLAMAAPGNQGSAPTSVTLFDQGLVQVLEAAVTGLTPKHHYLLALAAKPDGTGPVQPLTPFMTNPAGGAIVNAIGPIRQIVQSNEAAAKRHLVILTGTLDKPGAPV